MRRGSVLQLVVIAVGSAGVATAVAIFVPWMPTLASREAGRIDFDYWFTSVIALSVFVLVSTVLIYSVINFRVKSDDWTEDGPPIHGNTRLEVFWTAIPFLLVTAISVVSGIVLNKDDNPGPDPLHITVIGQQFAWTFEYPNGQIYPTLHVPIDRKILFSITSRDVIHGFWVPQWAQKQDAVPGITTHLVVTPDRLGIYPVICVELCGLGHALMRSEAIVMTQAQYAAWYKGATPSVAATTGTAGAIRTFSTSGCSSCHTFAAIPGALGKIGPSLDDLSPVAASLHESLSSFVQNAIVSPYSHVPPGYKAGVMPPDFGQTIPKAQLAALVQFIAAHTH